MINQESHDQFNEDHKNVQASPEFRKFMAKKLSSVLDRNLRMTLSKKKKAFDNENSEENEEDTFRLFSSSRCALNLDTPEPAPSIKRMRPHIGRNTKKLSQASKDQDSSDSDVEDQRLAEAAISGHQILSFAAFLPSFSQPAEKLKCSSSDTVGAPHVKYMRTRPDGTLNICKVKMKDRELSEVDSSEEVVKKKKVDTNYEKVDIENCQAGVVSPSQHSGQKDQYVHLHHVDKYSNIKHKKRAKKCKPKKDFEQSVEEEYAGSGKHIFDEKVNSHSEEAVEKRRRKKKKVKRKEELR